MKYLSLYPKYLYYVDPDVKFEINSNFDLRELRTKNYKIPGQKYGIRVGKFLTDLKRIFAFIDIEENLYVIKIYDEQVQSYTLKFMSEALAEKKLRRINLGKCIKSYNEKTITSWDVYNAGKNKNLFLYDNLVFYSPKPKHIFIFLRLQLILT